MLNVISRSSMNFFTEQIGKRVYNLASIPYSACGKVKDTAIGVITGSAAFGAAVLSLPLGHSQTGNKVFHHAMKRLDSSREILAKPYSHLLRVINPNAQIQSGTPYIQDGIITNITSQKLRLLGDRLRSEGRYAAARLTYSLLAVSSVITRIADFVIGAACTPLSLVTFGKIRSLNNLAYRGLQLPGLIKDLTFCAIKIINPRLRPAG